MRDVLRRVSRLVSVLCLITPFLLPERSLAAAEATEETAEPRPAEEILAAGEAVFDADGNIIDGAIPDRTGAETPRVGETAGGEPRPAGDTVFDEDGNLIGDPAAGSTGVFTSDGPTDAQVAVPNNGANGTADEIFDAEGNYIDEPSDSGEKASRDAAGTGGGANGGDEAAPKADDGSIATTGGGKDGAAKDAPARGAEGGDDGSFGSGEAPVIKEGSPVPNAGAAAIKGDTTDDDGAPPADETTRDEATRDEPTGDTGDFGGAAPAGETDNTVAVGGGDLGGTGANGADEGGDDKLGADESGADESGEDSGGF